MGLFNAGLLSAFDILICIIDLQKGDQIVFSKLI